MESDVGRVLRLTLLSAAARGTLAVDAGISSGVAGAASGTFTLIRARQLKVWVQSVYLRTEIYCCEVGRQVPGHLTANQMECLRRVLAAQHDEDAMAKKPAKKKTKTKGKAKGKSKSKKK
jgi:hypothetical protein